MKKGARRVTIKDVAKKAGVTHPTVSRALNRDPRVSESTRVRIERIARQLGYRPNLIARSLVTSETRIVACIIPDLNPHVQPILRGVVDACTRNRYGLMLFSTTYWSEEDQSYLWVVDNWRVDGVLIYNVVHREEAREDARRVGGGACPIVFINKYLTKPKVNAVAVDNAGAVEQAVAHLVEQGHTRVGIMDGGMLSVDGVERHEGFVRALARRGLPYREEWSGRANFSDEEAYVEMGRILDGSGERPTAIFCANDLMALGVLRALEARGLRVPDDMAVVGFDDLEAGRHIKPALTTLQPPLREVGGQAVDLLVKLMQKPGRPAEQIPLSAKLLVRGTSVRSS